MELPASAFIVRECASTTLVVGMEGRFDAKAEADLEGVMQKVRRSPCDLVFDVSRVDRLDVEGILLLAEHAQWLRRRTCSVSLRGAAPEAEQLARLLGCERVLGLG